MRYTKEYLTEQSKEEYVPIWKKILNDLGLGTVFGAAAATGQLGKIVRAGLSPIGAQMPRMSPASHAGGKSSFHTAVKDITGTVTSGTIGAAKGAAKGAWKGITRQKGPFSEYPDDPRRKK